MRPIEARARRLNDFLWSFGTPLRTACSASPIPTGMSRLEMISLFFISRNLRHENKTSVNRRLNNPLSIGIYNAIVAGWRDSLIWLLAVITLFVAISCVFIRAIPSANASISAADELATIASEPTVSPAPTRHYNDAAYRQVLDGGLHCGSHSPGSTSSTSNTKIDASSLLPPAAAHRTVACVAMLEYAIRYVHQVGPFAHPLGYAADLTRLYGLLATHHRAARDFTAAGKAQVAMQAYRNHGGQQLAENYAALALEQARQAAQQNNRQAAKSYLDEAYSIAYNLLGDFPDFTSTTLELLEQTALQLDAHRRHKQAEQLYRLVITGQLQLQYQQRQRGIDFPAPTHTHQHLVNNLNLQGKHRDALRLQNKYLSN